MTNGNTFKSAESVNNSFFFPIEGPFVNWLASYVPSWISPDNLTFLGFLAMIFAGICYALAPWSPWFLLAVNIFLVINWFGDSLDGTIARLRSRQRPRYGFYIDHIADTFGALFLIAGLALSTYFSPILAAAVLVLYFMLAINSYLAAYTMGVFRLSVWKFGPTEMRVLLIFANIFAFMYPVVYVFGQQRLLFDVAGSAIAVGLGVVLTASVLQNIIFLYRTDKVQ